MYCSHCPRYMLKTSHALSVSMVAAIPSKTKQRVAGRLPSQASRGTVLEYGSSAWWDAREFWG